MAEAYVDPDMRGRVHFFSGYGPADVLGDCPHNACGHYGQSVIAWGPDERRYVLVTCDDNDGCAGHCRGWADTRQRVTVWRLVGDEHVLPHHDRDIRV